MEMSKGDSKKLEGIRGWLLVFVILWSIGVLFDFFIIFWNIFISFNPIVGIIVKPNLVFVNILLTSILFFLEIICLILIFKRKQSSVKWVVSTIAYGTLYVLVWYIIISFLSLWTSLASMNVVFSNPVFGIISILYFIKSKRVKNTLVK